MFDVTEIQTIVDETNAKVSKQDKGFMNAVAFQLMYESNDPIFVANRKQLFVWATGDYNLLKYFKTLKLEGWKKHKAIQLTTSNIDEFFEVLLASEDYPSHSDVLKLRTKLLDAFKNLEAEKSNQIELGLGSISKVLARSGVRHVRVAYKPLRGVNLALTQIAYAIYHGLSLRTIAELRSIPASRFVSLIPIYVRRRVITQSQANTLLNMNANEFRLKCLRAFKLDVDSQKETLNMLMGQP